jgi:transposase-like protein
MPIKRHAPYPLSFKQAAVARLEKEKDAKKIAASLKIATSALYSWRAALKKKSARNGTNGQSVVGTGKVVLPSAQALSEALEHLHSIRRSLKARLEKDGDPNEDTMYLKTSLAVKLLEGQA